MSIDLTEAWSVERRATAARERERFFASGEPIPALDLMPSCPICVTGDMDVDEQSFRCNDCGVEWDRYGENGKPDELHHCVCGQPIPHEEDVCRSCRTKAAG